MGAFYNAGGVLAAPVINVGASGGGVMEEHIKYEDYIHKMARGL